MILCHIFGLDDVIQNVLRDVAEYRDTLRYKTPVAWCAPNLIIRQTHSYGARNIVNSLVPASKMLDQPKHCWQQNTSPSNFDGFL